MRYWVTITPVNGNSFLRWIFIVFDWPVTIYCESPEKAQSHIQPLDVSPGLLLLMLSSVMSEKFDVLQILQVWSAEQVAKSLEITIIRKQLF